VQILTPSFQALDLKFYAEERQSEGSPEEGSASAVYQDLHAPFEQEEAEYWSDVDGPLDVTRSAPTLKKCPRTADPKDSS
jgi:hypothetical protein